MYRSEGHVNIFAKSMNVSYEICANPSVSALQLWHLWHSVAFFTPFAVVTKIKYHFMFYFTSYSAKQLTRCSERYSKYNLSKANILLGNIF